MYLKSVSIEHYRGFNNKVLVNFTKPEFLKDGKQDIGKSTTMFVGKNNSGKTTVFKLLDNLVNVRQFKGSDFNYFYLKEYLDSNREDELFIEAIFEVFIDIQKDLSTNINDFITNESLECGAPIIIKARITVTEQQLFLDCITKIREKKESVSKLIKAIDGIGLSLKFFNVNNNEITNFRLSNLIFFQYINAQNLNTVNYLSTLYGGMITNNYKRSNISADELDDAISDLNNTVKDKIINKTKDYVSGAIAQVVKKDISMESNLTIEKILRGGISFYYSDTLSNFNIPEDQYGLGYSRIMSIAGEIMEGLRTFTTKNKSATISLIAIEEPEMYMHPQLQKRFLTIINKCIDSLIKKEKIETDTQIVISTHSPHIITSKIEETNSLNNIDYFNPNLKEVVCLENAIYPNNDKENYRFLLKHMTTYNCEIFFCDGLLLVEGFAEEKILPQFIDNYINKYKKETFDISVIAIGGAFAQIYEPLLTKLGIPTVVITDADFKDKECIINAIECNDELQTTNNSIKKLCPNQKIKNIIKGATDTVSHNIKLVTQNPLVNLVPDTFEVAFLLANYSEATFKRLNLDFDEKNKLDCLKNAYSKISQKKGDFITNIMFRISNGYEFNFPKYFDFALNSLFDMLRNADGEK